jgi:Na+-driven multidrug efflux pump
MYNISYMFFLLYLAMFGYFITGGLMSHDKNFLNKYIGDKVFYKSTLVIAIPILAQMLFLNLSQLVDNIMVGTLSEASIAAVYVSNKIFFIIQFIFFGTSGASEIFISQYSGIGELENINKIFNLNVIFSIIIGLLSFLFVNLNYTFLISLFDNSPQVIYLATTYLRIISFTFILFGINIAYSFGFRAYHMPKIPMYISIVTVFLNVILNYLLIFGVSSYLITLPPMGIKGAALATLIVRILETLAYITISNL